MEENISLKEMAGILKKRIGMIVFLITGAALISGAVSYFVLTPTYEASSQFIVNQKEQSNEIFDVNQIRSNVELINTYNVIITSPAILDRVAEEMELTMSSSQLGEKIAVSNAENSQVVTVTVTDPDQAQAVDIANKTVEVFQQRIPDLMNVDNIRVLSPAELNPEAQPVNPKPLLNIAIALVLGGIIGTGLAFLLEYLDNTVKTESDIEKKSGLPVIGVISHVSSADLAPVKIKEPYTNKAGGGVVSGVKKKTV